MLQYASCCTHLYTEALQSINFVHLFNDSYDESYSLYSASLLF